ncbi:MAG: T9SS type A sorting domain-containing protein, partial [Bacteroidales bacterium]|nr:T9SS type A sorting domain-containing protein [Bacteroidales bacterium]
SCTEAFTVYVPTYVYGTVTAPQGDQLSEAVVIFTNGEYTCSCVTDPNGQYEIAIAALETPYEVCVHYDGLNPICENLILAPYENTELNFDMGVTNIVYDVIAHVTNNNNEATIEWSIAEYYIDSVEYYDVYRLIEGNEANPETWTMVGNTSETSISDPVFSNLTPNSYRYAVNAVDTSSTLNPIFSNAVTFTSYLIVHVSLLNGLSADGAEVTISSDYTNFNLVEISENGLIHFYSIPYSPEPYTITVNHWSSQSLIQNVNLSLDTINELYFILNDSLPIEEAILTPSQDYTSMNIKWISDFSEVQNFTVYRLLDGDQLNQDEWTIIGTTTDTLIVDEQWGILNPGMYRYVIKSLMNDNVEKYFSSEKIEHLEYQLIEGSISSPSRNLISGVEILVIGDNGNYVNTTTTDESGNFSFGVPFFNTEFSLSTSVQGYQNYNTSFICSDEAFILQMDITLEPLNIQITELSTLIENQNTIQINWNYSQDEELQGFNICRNNELIATTTATTYTDINLQAGTYEYCISAVTDMGETVPECTTSSLSYNPFCLDIYSNTGLPLTNLETEVYESCNDSSYLFSESYFCIETCDSYSITISADGHYSYQEEINNIEPNYIREVHLIEIINPPLNFSAEADCIDAQLQWSVPSEETADRALLGYNIYRDDEIIIELTQDTTFIDHELEPGTYTYYVTADYSTGESDPTESISIYINHCKPEINFVSPHGVDITGCLTAEFQQWDWYQVPDLHIATFYDFNEIILLFDTINQQQYYAIAYYADCQLSSDTITINYDNINTENHATINIFPNPAEDHFNIESNTPIKQLSISDLSGKVLLHQDCNGLKQKRINIEQLPNGIYFVNLITNHYNKSCYKLVVNH